MAALGAAQGVRPASRAAARSPRRACRRAGRRARAAASADGVSPPGVQLPAFAAVPEGVSQEDMSTFIRVVAGGDWAAVQRAVQELAVEGALTEGVLEAAAATVERAEKLGEDERIVASLKAVFELMLVTATGRTPVVELVESLLELDPACAEVKERLVDAVESGVVQKAELIAKLESFLQQMEQQDADFSAQAASVVESEDEAVLREFYELMQARNEAKSRMQQIMATAEAL